MGIRHSRTGRHVVKERFQRSKPTRRRTNAYNGKVVVRFGDSIFFSRSGIAPLLAGCGGLSQGLYSKRCASSLVAGSAIEHGIMPASKEKLRNNLTSTGLDKRQKEFKDAFLEKIVGLTRLASCSNFSYSSGLEPDPKPPEDFFLVGAFPGSACELSAQSYGK